MAGTAASLEGAVPLLDPAVVDVLLLDIRLGSESGLTLLGARGGPRPAIVVLTAYDYPQYAAAALRLGAAGFVVKTAPMRGAGRGDPEGRGGRHWRSGSGRPA